MIVDPKSSERSGNGKGTGRGHRSGSVLSGGCHGCAKMHLKVLQYDAKMLTEVLLSFSCCSCRKADQRLAGKKLDGPAAPKQGFLRGRMALKDVPGATANFHNWRSSQQSVGECGWDRRRPLTRELSTA